MAQGASSDADVDRDDDLGDEDVDDDEGVDDEDEDDSDDKESDKDSPEERRKQRLSREAARHRIRAKKALKRVGELEAEVNRLKTEGVSDEEGKRLKTENDDLKTKVSDLESRLKTFTVGDEIRNVMADLKLKPERYKAIIKLLDMDEIDVDDDGEVSGVQTALEAIAQDYPEWVISASGDNDDEGNSDRTSGQSSRKPGKNGRKGSQIDKNALLSRYPALQQGHLG